MYLLIFIAIYAAYIYNNYRNIALILRAVLDVVELKNRGLPLYIKPLYKTSY